MPDMPARTIRYIAKLAEEQNFGRAARALGISTPTLSTQVRRLEELLGAPLFQRSRSGAVLTALGAEFLEKSLPLVHADDDMQSWLAETIGRGGRISIGIVAGGVYELGALLLARLRRERPGIDITVHTVSFGSVVEEILRGRSDIVITPAPFSGSDDSGIERVRVRGAFRAVILPTGHRLAQRDSVSIQELSGETFLVPTGVDPQVLAWWLVDPRPDGSHPRSQKVGPDFEGILAGVSAGMGVNLTTTEAQSLYARPDLRIVKVPDAPPASVEIAFHVGRRDPLLRSFLALASELRESGSETDSAAGIQSPAPRGDP